MPKDEGRLHILLVEDNLDTAEPLGELLQYTGYSVRHACDGTSALAVLGESTFDVVLLDVGLPDMSGFEVARRIRCVTDADTTHIVTMTGFGEPKDIERSKEIGIEHHLIKPVDPRVLLRLIASLCSSTS